MYLGRFKSLPTWGRNLINYLKFCRLCVVIITDASAHAPTIPFIWGSSPCDPWIPIIIAMVIKHHNHHDDGTTPSPAFTLLLSPNPRFQPCQGSSSSSKAVVTRRQPRLPSSSLAPAIQSRFLGPRSDRHQTIPIQVQLTSGLFLNCGERRKKDRNRAKCLNTFLWILNNPYESNT